MSNREYSALEYLDHLMSGQNAHADVEEPEIEEEVSEDEDDEEYDPEHDEETSDEEEEELDDDEELFISKDKKMSWMTARWPMAVFYNILDVSAYNAFVVWMAINPGWNARNTFKRRLFLEELGRALVTPHIERRQWIPRTPASANLTSRIHTNTPQTSRIHTNTPQTSRIHTNTPQTSHIHTNTPQTSHPHTNTPQTSRPHASRPSITRACQRW
ncbi:hypothetical protein AAFF_G00102640 [Aldrovandia affinis]|uniref:PiggyBac transposable element-derived protein domain-containing protein n=1 Tax=Aldrovandia affinis TaxID=143900 RepID=A0AAD7R172_9TELE|nr:hypothetical protein AAFF_G00102640 [Aldrovandia affinis]